MQFNVPSRQSAKGILVILGISLYKVFKQVLILISLFLVKYLTGEGEAKPIPVFLYMALLGIILFLAINAYLKYRTFFFSVSESHFIVNKGIINKEEISIPKHKIQNVFIKQNFIQQLIHVVSVAVETAGDDSTEIEIKALSRDKAEQLKKALLADKKASIEEEIVPKQDVYFKASISKLLLEGISENHFRSFVIILFFIVGLYNDFKELLKSIKIETRFNEYFQFNETEILGIILFNIVLVLSILAVAFMFSLVRTLIENFGLKVTEHDEGLEISKGLFNKINLGLKPSRIQNTQLRTNSFKKLIGLYQVSFTQAMLNKKQRNNFKIIGLSRDMAKELITRFYSELSKVNKKLKPEYYFIIKHSLVNLVFIGICNTIFYLTSWQMFWINIPLVTIVILAIRYKYKKAYFSFDDNYIIVGSGGLIETKTDFLELHKVQAVNISQTIFQKRRGLASMKIYSASRALHILHIKQELANDLNNFLLYKVESSERSWM